MKRWILLIVLVVGLSGAATLAVSYLPVAGSNNDIPITLGRSSSTGPKPKAVLIGANVFEFGTLPQRTTGKHSWTVKNDGQGELEIWMVSSTCSCTLAKFKDGKKAVVKAGDSTEIDLEYETRENNGNYAKGAEIGTNDPDLPSFSLGVKGMVFPAVQTFPADPYINLSSISNDQDDHFTKVAIYSKDRPETKVVKVTTSNKNVEAIFEPTSPEEIKSLPEILGVKSASTVKVNVKSGLSLGLFREEIVITTDHPKQPEIRMMVSGKMIGPVNPVPSSISMHEVYGKAGASTEAMLVVREQRPTKFEVVKKPERLRVEIAPIEGVSAPGRYRMIVTVPPGTTAERIEDEIVLKTDHPKASRLSIPVSIWILNGG
jgi:hypothetical protein